MTNIKQYIIGGGVVFALIVMGIVQLMVGSDEAGEVSTSVRQDVVQTSFEKDSSAITKAKDKIKERSREIALEEIAEHQEAIARNWSAPDTPDRIIATGNLYQYQLGDYYSAIEQYRSIIDGYPEHSKVPQVYIDLATCYERMGDEAEAEIVYREMVDSLDPSLQRVKFAKLKLEGK